MFCSSFLSMRFPARHIPTKIYLVYFGKLESFTYCVNIQYKYQFMVKVTVYTFDYSCVFLSFPTLLYALFWKWPSTFGMHITRVVIKHKQDGNLRVKNAQTADLQAPPKRVSQGGHADQSPRANTPSFVGDHNASDTNRRKKQEGSQTHSGSCRSNPEITQGQAGHVQDVTSIKKEASSRYKFLYFMYFFISDIHEA